MSVFLPNEHPLFSVGLCLALFSFEAVPGPFLGQCLIWNQFFFFCFDRQRTGPRPENSGSKVAPGLCWAREKEAFVSGSRDRVAVVKHSQRKDLGSQIVEKE